MHIFFLRSICYHLYSQEKCVRHAQKCVRQARLVALQLHYLPAGNQLLHLSDEEADDVICQHPKFLEVNSIYGSIYRITTKTIFKNTLTNVLAIGIIMYDQ